MPTPLRPAALAAALVSLVASLAGCGSSGDAPPPAPVFLQGTVGPDATLRVAGVPFSTRGAVLRLLDDGTSTTLATEEEARTLLREGMVVAVRGEIAGDGSRRASEVVYRSVLRGPLAGRAASQLAVAGADVDLDDATVLLDAAGAPTTPEGLPAGGRVEVSGWPDGGNRVRATLVRALPGTPAVAVHGWTLSAPVDGVFDLSLVRGGGALLRVDASGATAPSPLPANALVRVTGSTITAGGPPALAAESVTVISQLLPFPDDRAVVEGVVTGGTIAELLLGEHVVATTAATAYEDVPPGGTAAAALAPGVRLVAEGTLAGGRLVAERIRFVALLRLAGRIAPTSFVIGNPATFAAWNMGSTSVIADLRTQIEGSGGERLTLRDLAELHGLELAGLPVVVHGYVRGDGDLQAQRVDVTPAP